MQSTRELILKTLRTRGQATVAELASTTGVSPVSVRHHLSALQAEGLATAEEIRHGVGRPRLVFMLTDLALERFPTKYVALTGRLIDELKSALPPEAIGLMFARMAEAIAAEHAQRLEGRSLEEKMAYLVGVLGEEGFVAEWNRAGEGYQLTEYNCPYFRIGQRHPEVCQIDQALMSALLATPVEKQTCVLNGDDFCVFLITPQLESAEV